MTEEEAKTKWCPFVRVLPETERWHPMTNREDTISAPKGSATTCIGSACAAWRWECVRDDYGGENGEPVILTETHGFCGLAGRP